MTPYEQLAAARAALAGAEEVALAEHCIDLAAEVIRLQYSEPLANRSRVAEKLEQLRRSIRSAIDWPVSAGPYALPPLVQQALALLPPRDALHVPLDEAGFGRDSWAEPAASYSPLSKLQRRRLLLNALSTQRQ